MNNNNSVNNDYNINDFLEYDVSSDEWFEAINDLKQLDKIICWNSLYQYMVEQNKKYTDEHFLCESCRSPIKEYIEYDGNKMISNIEWSCPNGC